MKILLFWMAIIIGLSSCSLVKSPTSNNFSRVKYNAHLKTTKRLQFHKQTATVRSFQEKENRSETNDDLVAELVNKPSKLLKMGRSSYNLPAKPTAAQSPKKKRATILLEEMNDMQDELEKAEWSSSQEYWWDNDPEDWPWLEIVLAVIAVLVIGIIIALFVNLIGGVIAGLMGLILLIALAYFLYVWWT